MIEFDDLVKVHEAALLPGKTLTDLLTKRHHQTSLPTKRLDMPKVMASIQANDYWHDNTLRLVGRLVHDGLTDEEILARAEEFQCVGYSLKQTVDELRVMIDGAREKGFHKKRDSATDIVNEMRPLTKGPLLRRLSEITLEPMQFLVDGLLPKGSLSTLFGDPGCGKSFVAIDIAMCVATGTSFHGKSVNKGAVIYIAGEGYRGLTQRAWAWLSENEISVNVAEIFISRTSVDIPDDDARVVKEEELIQNLDLICILF